MKDYYKILSIERSDSSATIKRVFRRLALKLHPDINEAPNAHQQFIDLNEAYQVLRNPVKRKQYNKLLDIKINESKDAKAQRKREKWESSIQTSVKKGKAKGEKYASETGRKFEKRTDSWASIFLVDLVIEITFRALGALFETLLDL